MTVREGSLEAPQRHPIDWQNPDFYKEELLLKELERQFDICHGCRRCFNLCQAFPTLFDLVDEGPTGEVDGVKKEDYWKVVDQCYLCDMCFMTKCPYVPPHPHNMDIPHLMLRAKAFKLRQNPPSSRDKLLSSTDAVGKLASIPVVVQLVNKVNNSPAMRALMENALGVHRSQALPPYTSATFRKTAAPQGGFPVKDGKRTSGKAAIYSTCYINYNEPGIGHDLLKILAHNEIPACIVEQEVCCGMPKLELGDLETVAKLKDTNIPQLVKLAREGYAILAAVPSCALMYKQELPLLFPDDADVKAVADAMFDPFEYLWLRNADGLLKTGFQKALGKIAYHVPCHLRVQNIGQKTREILEKVPGTQVSVVERCSGHDGTYGVKKEYYDCAVKIGKPVFKQMAAAKPDYLTSDCPIAARHIAHGIGAEAAEKQHPLTLLRIAYGL